MSLKNHPKRKATIVFPGQGSQYVGMGSKTSLHYFERANELLNINLKSICLEGPREQLNLTPNTQPAIVVHSIALWEELRPRLEAQGISVCRVLGHSVGEYAALVSAGAMSFEDAVLSTRLRGQLMEKALPSGQGAMSAILGQDIDLVGKTCKAVEEQGQEVVEVANYNSPEQVVISGHRGAVKKVSQILSQHTQSKFRAIPLPVSGPFHSKLMKPAAEKLAHHLQNLSLRPLKISYVANTDGKEYTQETSGDVMRRNLIQQVYSSVQWTKSTQTFEEGALVIEVGPGQVLKGLIKKCRPDATCYSVDRDGMDFLELEKGQ